MRRLSDRELLRGMNELFRRLRGQREHKYAPIGQERDAGDDFTPSGTSRSVNIWTKKHIGLLIMVASLTAVLGVLGIG